jgi:hypothetical protein
MDKRSLISKFISNNYENFLLSIKFARNFDNLRSTKYV